MSDPKSEPKIIVDSDWKQEAAEDKKRLDEQTRAAPESRALPQPGFIEIVNLLVMQAAVGLGGYKAPTGENLPPDLPMAKHFIDLLEVLQKKTEGNLADDEKKALDAMTYEMRMRYVEAVPASPAEAPEKK